MANHKNKMKYRPIWNRKILRNILKKNLNTNKIGNQWRRLKAEGRI